MDELPFQTWKLECFIHMPSQTIEEKTLTNKLSIIFFSTSISFSSFSLPSALFKPSFFILSFFYFLLQPMLVLTDLPWCHKSQLHFIRFVPQIKGTFIKIECFKTKPCPFQKKMTRVHGSNIT